ncbi:MAG: hypothetical protein ACK5MD_04185 [Flavobacteriales bacterium]
MNTEKFNIDDAIRHQKLYKEYERRQIHLDLGNTPYLKIDTLKDGTVIEYSWWDEKDKKTYYRKTITPPPPALFYTTKNFYPSGIIKEEQEDIFIGTLWEPAFTVKEYDEQGYLIKTIDNSNFDKGVDFKFNDLLLLLQKEPIIREINNKDRENFSFYLFHGEVKKGDVTAEKIIDYLLSEDCNGKILNPNSDFDRKNLTISLENDLWLVTKDMYPQGFWDYKIDANTGKILNVDYRGDQRP